MFTIDQLNSMRQEAFVTAFGGIYEHAPWVAENAWRSLPVAGLEELAEAMSNAMQAAPRQQKLELIRNHPRLGIIAKAPLTADSANEQRSAGLDDCPEEQRAELVALNRDYERRFSFPFVLAVRGRNVSEIIEVMKTRLGNDATREFDEALKQVSMIARLRLSDRIAEAK